MAQQFFKTEGLDTKTWLDSHNLGDLYPKFAAAKFTIEDLVICDEDTIK